MKLLDQDRKEGYMRLEVESDADIWHLKHVVEPGDTLRSEDRRTTIEGGEKARVTLTLETEKIDYQGSRLRATGEITAAPEEVQHGYHTFNLEPGVVFDIWKPDWKQYQIDRVQEATTGKDYEVVVCMIDKQGSTIARVTETGIEEIAAIGSNVSGKMYDDASDRSQFYGQVISVLAEHADVDRIILAGPGFEKENLQDTITADHPDLATHISLEDASTTGMTGVNEVIKRGAIKRVLKESRVADEVAAVEDLLERIEKDEGTAAYGSNPVQAAVEQGAVEQVLINDVLVAQQEQLMERVEQQGGSVQIVHEDHDAGKQLAALGGIAALLRYRIE